MRNVIIIAFIICLSACHHEPGYTILFDKVKDVKIGTKVLLEGVTVGSVTKTYFRNADDSRLVVNFELTNNIKIPAGSKFTAIETLLGETYIMIKPSASAQFMQPTDTVAGVYMPLKNILDPADSVQREKVKQSLNKIGEGVKEILQTLKDSTDTSINR